MSQANIDDTITTSSIPSPVETDPAQSSDASVVRNAVSAVDLKAATGAPLSWANQDTGSTGTISEVRESEVDGQLCRNFKTSRESFEGIAMYAGATCMNAEKQWFVRNFVAL
ncbi:MAG: RT0821/Lpp0805 family surface protein [Rhizobiaceae bacterium]